MSIQVENLTKIYGVQRALDGITFEAKQGEILGFLGPNGAGKSTTMKILTCYIPQTTGIAKVCGFDVATQPMDVKKHIGYLPELNPLYTDMYVKEYLQFTADVQGIGKDAKKRVEEMIERVGLTVERKKKISQLSKGYKQRVGLAQAMLNNPSVLILDEPTSGLDPNQVVEIRELIKEIGKDKTVLLSTHIMQEVESMCTRVIIINKGKIVANDNIEQLQKSQSSGVTIVVEFKHEANINQLKQIAGVKEVKQKGKTYVIKAADDVREQLSAFAVQHNLVLLSMSLEEHSLESVFQKLTTK
jgi:ABC-2 type transport system ATP-binding protein